MSNKTNVKKGEKGFKTRGEMDNKDEFIGDNNVVHIDVIDDIFQTDLEEHLQVQGSKTKRIIESDFRKPYGPSDNIFRANIGPAAESDDKRRFSLHECDSWMNFTIGIGETATHRVAGDATKNGFEFIKDIDKEDAKPITFPKFFEWMRSSGLLDMIKYWKAYDLGMGIGFSIGHWDKELKKIQSVEDVQKGVFGKSNFIKKLKLRGDLTVLAEPPPKTPPDRFEVINPLYFYPRGETLTKSKKLNYDNEEWEFSGGIVKTAIKIHRDRVFVLNTREYSGWWRGRSVFDSVRFSILGYFNDLIYVQRGIQNWGDSVQVLKYGNKLFDKAQQKKIMGILRLMEMNGRLQIPTDADFISIPTNIGKGIKEAHSLYEQDLSSGWRIPLNQLFGRSEGGGLTAGPAIISKEDYYERVGDEQSSITHPLLRQIIWRFFPKTKGHWLRWHLNIYKTDEQRLKEEGMKLDNDLKKKQVKLVDQEVKMKKEERTMMLLQGLQQAQGLAEGGEGGDKTKPTEKDFTININDFKEYKKYIKKQSEKEIWIFGNGTNKNKKT